MSGIRSLVLRASVVGGLAVGVLSVAGVAGVAGVVGVAGVAGVAAATVAPTAPDPTCGVGSVGYPPHQAGLVLSTSRSSLGDTVSFTVTGVVTPGSASVTVDRRVPALATVTVAPNGSAAGTVLVPRPATGPHELEVTCPDGGALVEGFTIAAPEPGPVVGTPPSSLPFTGFGVMVAVDAALTLLIGGAVVRTAARRRRPRRR